jgi:CPA2 family monovalent cation:H+ antiporter-2
MRVGMGLAQIGEFSFIIASLGLSLRVTSEFLYPIAVTVSAITSLLTPLLLKRADAVVNSFERVAPPRLAALLADYTRWLGQWRASRHRGITRRLVRRWMWQMLLNLTLVAGIFISAGVAFNQRPGWLPALPGGSTGLGATLWLGAALLSLPLLIATFRKLQALGLLVGEIAAARAQNKEWAAAIQAVIANTVLVIGMSLIALGLLLLSVALLPSWKVLLLPAAIVAVVTVLLWRHFIRIYSKAQLALHDTLAELPNPTTPVEPPTPFAGLLKDAQIATVPLTGDSPARNKLIREVGLRTLTGASIISIERKGGNIVNPGPDEELLAGDQVLLLGAAPQLEAARRHLIGPAQ